LNETLHGTEIEIVNKKADGSLLVYGKDGDVLCGKRRTILSTERVAALPRHCVY
jgi:hypothetical protein